MLSALWRRLASSVQGALGNMVRNSPLLCPELVRCGALEALLALVSDAPPGAAAGVGDGQNPLKIGLFSLGNLCSHGACRAHLAALGLRAAVAPLVDLLRDADDKTRANAAVRPASG